MRRYILLYILLASIGIASCQPTYWIDGPRSIQRIDSLSRFGPSLYRSFTAIPYSELDSASVQLSGNDENAMLFALVNKLISRGYRYVDDIDSADFIVTECVRTDFNLREKFDSTRFVTVPMKRVLPFSFISSSFGSLDHKPRIPRYDSRSRAFPELTIIVYDARTLKEIGQYQAGGVASSQNALVASQLLLPESFFHPFFNPTPIALPVGKGQSGIRPTIWTSDGLNFWPAIYVFPNTPAAASGLKTDDEILEIDGRSMQNIDIVETMHRMKSDVGRRMIYTVWRWPNQVFLDTLVTGPRN
ncbi:MAG: PDZ domain-containing protein [Bacteroidota bacterium]|nr:PDZ domain-containing protein [Bacteroidota bacterium]MDP4288359.1 PDZ domain-containing protein [Bacteroidota bacterium]